jgi:hypothetical protein
MFAPAGSSNPEPEWGDALDALSRIERLSRRQTTLEQKIVEFEGLLAEVVNNLYILAGGFDEPSIRSALRRMTDEFSGAADAFIRFHRSTADPTQLTPNQARGLATSYDRLWQVLREKLDLLENHARGLAG